MDSDATSNPLLKKTILTEKKILGLNSTLGYNVYIEGEQQQLSGENESCIVKNDRDKKQIY